MVLEFDGTEKGLLEAFGWGRYAAKHDCSLIIKAIRRTHAIIEEGMVK